MLQLSFILTLTTNPIEMQLNADHNTNRLRIIFASTATSTRHEVDAVGLIGPSSQTHWATAAADITAVATMDQLQMTSGGKTIATPFRGFIGVVLTLGEELLSEDDLPSQDTDAGADA